MNEEIKSALIRILPFLVILIVLLVRVKQRKINPLELNIQKPFPLNRFLLWTIGFLTYVLLTELTFYKLGMLETERWNHPLISSIIRILGAVILAPIAEELIFRGLILNLLRKRIQSLHFAIFIQACFFVLLHNFTYQNTLTSNIAIIQSLVDAMLFGYARVYTKSIYTSVTMHMIGNLIATLERFIF